MDGLFSLTLLAGLGDLGILAASVLLAVFSALALVRQIFFAIIVQE